MGLVQQGGVGDWDLPEETDLPGYCNETFLRPTRSFSREIPAWTCDGTWDTDCFARYTKLYQALLFKTQKKYWSKWVTDSQSYAEECKKRFPLFEQHRERCLCYGKKKSELHMDFYGEFHKEMVGHDATFTALFAQCCTQGNRSLSRRGGRASSTSTIDVEDTVGARASEPGASVGGSASLGSNKSSSGWTTISAPPKLKILYVSNSSGNDSSNGFSTLYPLKTLQAAKEKAYELARYNYNPWILLRCGDTWSVQTLSQFELSGYSSDAPLLISSYVDPKIPSTKPPKIIPPIALPGIFFKNTANVKNIMISHINFDSGVSLSQGADGIRVENTSNVLIEGCLFTNIGSAVYGNDCNNIKLRRNVVNLGANLFASNRPKNILIEENILNNISALGIVAVCDVDAPPTGQTITINKNLFLNHQQGTRAIFSDLYTNASDNLFSQVPIAMELGGSNYSALPDGTIHNLFRNVILEINHVTANAARGMILKNTKQARIENNIFANSEAGRTGVALFLDGKNSGGVCRNALVRNNIAYGWDSGSVGLVRLINNIDDIIFATNQLAAAATGTHVMYTYQSTDPGDPVVANMNDRFLTYGNKVYSGAAAGSWFYLYGTGNVDLTAWNAAIGGSNDTSFDPGATFSDPDAATLAGYMSGNGLGSTHADFVTAALAQNVLNWDTNYTADVVNAWISAQF